MISGAKRARDERLDRAGGATVAAAGAEADRRAARAACVAVVPRLPAVPLHEAEPRRVRGEPGVCLARAEIELGGVAVEALAGRRHPLRVRVRGEQARLLGIRAEAARDAEEDAGLPAGRGRHPVERQRHVRPHRLALAVGERAVVSTAAGDRRQAAGPEAWRQLRRGLGSHRDALARDPRRSVTPASPRTLTLTRVGANSTARKAHVRRLRCARRSAPHPERRRRGPGRGRSASSRWRGFGMSGARNGGSNRRG